MTENTTQRVSPVLALAIFGIVQGCGLLAVDVINPRWFVSQVMVNIVAFFTYGVVYAQISLAAATCAWGSARLWIRFPLALAWAAMLIGINYSHFGISDGRIDNGEWIRGWSALSVFVIVQIPMWLLRWRWGLRIARRVNSPVEIQQSSTTTYRRFGIRDLLVVTLLAALLCSLERWIGFYFSDLAPQRSSGQTLLEMLEIMISLTISSSIVALIVIPGAMLFRRWAMGILMGAMATVVFLIVGFAIQEAYVPFNRSGWWFLVIIHIEQYAWLMISLVLLRAGGYQLRQA